MVLTLSALVPSVVMTAGAAEEAETANEELLEKFGFSLDPSEYNTNALKPGTHPIEPKYDLYLGSYSMWIEFEFSKTDIQYGPVITKFISSTVEDTSESAKYFVSEGFAATGTGVETHIAKVYFEDSTTMGDILISIYDSDRKPLVTGYPTGGSVISSDKLEMWEVEGLLSMSTGDFDGDGYDEIAVYTPNNVEETSSGSVHSDIYVRIFEFDASTNTITPKQSIDLTSKESSDEICEWEYSHNGSKKQFYCLPYVALSADKYSDDDIDDLMAVVSFSTWYRGTSGKAKYTTPQILNHNTCFASVLEGYEGTNGGELQQTIKHKMLVTEGLTGGASNEETKNRFVLRNANITIGDVTAEGSREVIIAGNYTRTTVVSKNDSITEVNSNRYAEVDGNGSLCHIVGYTTYDNLKKRDMQDINTGYSWAVRSKGFNKTYWYNEDDTDSGPITVSLNAFKRRGIGYPATIFVGGQFFEYNSETAELEFVKNYSANDGSLGSIKDYSVVWIGKSISGNLANDMFGKQVLLFTYYYKVSGKNQFACDIMLCAEATSSMEYGGDRSDQTQMVTGFTKSSTQQLASLALLDGGGKTSYITYDGDNTEIYYTDVELLAIMQAPPLYEELEFDGGDYIGESSTGFEKSESSASGTSHGGSLTAGVVAGFEQETSFLGLFKCAGAEYEFSITGTVSYDHSTETSTSYATGFETSGVRDTAVVFTVPYVRYNCTMYMPEYKLPTEEQYNEICAFRDELLKNLEEYIELGEEQVNGKCVKGCRYYEYMYSSYVNEDNFQDQLAVYHKVEEEIDFIEKAIASFGKGGTGEWGGTVESAVLPYHYNVPQTPMVTTIDVATYDAIAEVTPGLDKIYGNVFHEGYRAGDPNTYAHYTSDINADGKILQSKQELGGSEDGFLTNSSTSTGGSSQSQTISVEESTSDTIGWGAAIENTSVANVGGAKIGFTVTAEYNGSSVKTSTEGNEYTGSVAALPDGTPSDYSYAWKLVAYNAKINGSKVPVVGYLTRITSTAPPSVAQNISVEDVTDTSFTLTWEDGEREADYYMVSRVAYDVNNNEVYYPMAGKITSVNGKCSYTVSNLKPESPSYYAIESYYKGGKKSVATQTITVITLPDGFSAVCYIDGIDQNVIHRNGKTLTASLTIEGNEKYDTYYRWQKDSGDGWKNIAGQNEKAYTFDISPIDNQSMIRCVSTIFIGSRSYDVYSSPIKLNCVRTVNGLSVDWASDGGSVTVTAAEDAEDADVYVVVRNGGLITGVFCKESSTEGATFDLSGVSEDSDVRVFVWNNNAMPLSMPFEG